MLTMSILIALLSTCSGGGLPNGRYAPIEEYRDVARAAIQAIIIDGDNFTVFDAPTWQDSFLSSR
jgi:hypothetical protein